MAAYAGSIAIDRGGPPGFFLTWSGFMLVVVIALEANEPPWFILPLHLVAFTVMALDRPLPGNRWVRLLVLGLLGTWSLNVVRLALLLLIGAIWGQSALELAHANAGYVLFAIWIAVFGGIYLREWRTWSAPERVER